VTGLLIPPGDPQAIARAVVELLDDPDRRRRMGVSARIWAREHYPEERVIGLTAAFYAGCISGCGSERGPKLNYIPSK